MGSRGCARRRSAVGGGFFAGEARPIVFSIVAVGLGTFIGVGWGSKKATETEEYRQEWFTKRKSSAADADDTPGADGDGR